MQPVKLIARELDETQSTLTLVKNSGGEERLELGRDAIISSRIEPAATLEAEMVFAGHGLSIPEAHHDDFEEARPSAASWSRSFLQEPRRPFLVHSPRTCRRKMNEPLCSSGWGQSAL